MEAFGSRDSCLKKSQGPEGLGKGGNEEVWRQ
jgi:hypothetical protein